MSSEVFFQWCLSFLEPRVEIQNSFDECPHYLVAGGSKLFVASLSGAYRVCRARLAGQWASAVASVRATTPQLGLRSGFRIVLRADRIQKPTIYKSADRMLAVCWELSQSNSISHSFPLNRKPRFALLVLASPIATC